VKNIFIFVMLTLPLFFQEAAGQHYNSSSPNTLSAASTFTDITCDHAWPNTSIKSKGNQPQAIQEGTYDTCASLVNWVYADVQPTDGPGMYRMQYDSIRLYVEHCGANDYNCYVVFNTLDADVQEYSTDTNRYNTYRDWLISVLYVNTINPAYYCNDLISVANTFAYGKYALPNAWFAVMKYLLDSKRCADSGMQVYYNRQLQARHQTWLEGDTTKPEDTTLPSLDQLGLGFLLTNSGVQPITAHSGTYLGSFGVSPNPSQGLITANYALARQGFVQFTVYDALGRQIWYKAGESEPEGLHQLPIDLRSSPSGTYYVRIEAGFGEVQTVKIVKEQ
jgi:hypothetical protein